MENKKITYLIVLWCYLSNVVGLYWTLLWESLLQIHITLIFKKIPKSKKPVTTFFSCMLTKAPCQGSSVHRGGAGLVVKKLAGHAEQFGALAEAAVVTPGSPMARAGHAREIQLQLHQIHSRLSIHSLITLLIFHRYKSLKFLTFPVQQEIQELITSPSDSTKVSNVWLSTTLIQLYLYSPAAYKEFGRNLFLILSHITVKV